MAGWRSPSPFLTSTSVSFVFVFFLPFLVIPRRLVCGYVRSTDPKTNEGASTIRTSVAAAVTTHLHTSPMIGCGNASQRRAHPIILMVTYAHLAFLPTNRLPSSLDSSKPILVRFVHGWALFRPLGFSSAVVDHLFATSFGALTLINRRFPFSFPHAMDRTIGR